MKKIENCSIIISVCSAFIAICCVCIIFCHNFKQGEVIKLDTFVGIGVALIGICATFIVGIQIISNIEIREMKNQMNELHNQMNDKINELHCELNGKIKEIYKLKHDIVETREDLFLVASNTYYGLSKTEENAPGNKIDSLVYCIYYISRRDLVAKPSEGLEDRYKSIEKAINSLTKNIKKPARLVDFCTISYPIEMKNYEEISKKHAEIIDLLLPKIQMTKPQ